MAGRAGARNGAGVRTSRRTFKVRVAKRRRAAPHPSKQDHACGVKESMRAGACELIKRQGPLPAALRTGTPESGKRTRKTY